MNDNENQGYFQPKGQILFAWRICVCKYVHLLHHSASPPPLFLGANRELPTRSSVHWCQPSRLYSGPTAWIARHISCHGPCPKLQRCRRRNLHSKFWRRTDPRLLPCESETSLSVVNVPFELNTLRSVPLCKVCAFLTCRTWQRCLTAPSPEWSLYLSHCAWIMIIAVSVRLEHNIHANPFRCSFRWIKVYVLWSEWALPVFFLFFTAVSQTAA